MGLQRTHNSHRQAKHNAGTAAAVLGWVVACVLVAACSTHKNTPMGRRWQAFTARYNTYYNGHQAFLEGNEQKEKGNKDDYTETLPLYMVGNKKSRSLGQSAYDRAIEKSEKTIKLHSIKQKPEWKKNRRKTEKDKEWLSRREYNPFLWNAWMLLGKAQFQRGSFEEAAATFAYTARLYQGQPAIRQQAQAWLARCYVELEWVYEAEDVLRSATRDSTHYRAQRDWDAARANYLIASGQLAEARPYLKQVISHERHGYRKARHYFLLGQIEASLGNDQAAYKAFQRVLRQSPPYELSFNARIAQTEVLAGHSSHDGQLSASARKMVRRLRGMARDDNNKDYLDQVYYAIGNIYMSAPDTLKALEAYEKGAAKGTRSGTEKGVLLLRMGDIYWTMERYNDAQRCYGQAVGMLDKERQGYEQLAERSKVLDELVPHTDAIHLQDSLQELALMPEAQRLEAIDSVIKALKEKEKAEERARQEAEAEKQGQSNQAQNARNNNSNRNNNTPTLPQQGKDATWYFYNPTAVNQGKQSFQRQWGKRENADNWQRINQTVVGAPALTENDEGADVQPDDTTATDSNGEQEEQKDAATDSLQNDPHQREYYLAQIPFTEEQKAASDDIIKEALLQSGIIFKDKLDNLRLAMKQLERLQTQYADYPQMDLAFYHLYLAYMRDGKVTQAQHCIDSLQQRFPDSEWTVLLSDPYFAENQRFGVHIEDSLYAATYQAFLDQNYGQVKGNSEVSAQRFPLGEHRPKFLFIDGLACLNEGDANGCLERMKTVVEKYPKSEVTEMAGMIVKGVGEGRVLHGGQFDLGDVWSLRGLTASADSTQQDTLSTDRNVPYLFVLAYQPDSLLSLQATAALHPAASSASASATTPAASASASALPPAAPAAGSATTPAASAAGQTRQSDDPTARENRLLFQMARYNFTNFLVRNFDIDIDRQEQLHRLTVSGFLSYDEALQYARRLYADPQMRQLLRPCRRIIISQQNLPLLGTRFSYNDYDEFYLKTLAPIKVSEEQLLLRPDVIVQPSEDDMDAPADGNEGDTDDGTQGTDDGFIDFGDDFF